MLSTPTALMVEAVLVGILLVAFAAGLRAARSVRVGRPPEAALLPTE
jgi:hypothetical protein